MDQSEERAQRSNDSAHVLLSDSCRSGTTDNTIKRKAAAEFRQLKLATTEETGMGSFTFWRTPEWDARRDARGSTLGHARIHRYVAAKPPASTPGTTASAQVAAGPVAGSDALSTQPVPYANPRS